MTCRLDGCENDAARYCDGYCGDICRNIAIKMAARQVYDWDITDEEIEQLVRENHRRLQDKLREASA